MNITILRSILRDAHILRDHLNNALQDTTDPEEKKTLLGSRDHARQITAALELALARQALTQSRHTTRQPQEAHE
jgi:hypothetical protein